MRLLQTICIFFIMTLTSYTEDFIIIVNKSAETNISRKELRKAFLNRSSKQPVSVYKKENKELKKASTVFLRFALVDDEAHTGIYKVEQIKRKMGYSSNVTIFVKDWQAMIEVVSKTKGSVGFLPKTYKGKLPEGVKICKVE